MRWLLAPVSLLTFFQMACSATPMGARDGEVRGGSSGGTPATGSADAAGGGKVSSSDSCPINSICFKNGWAQGLMSGPAWVNIGEQGVIETPTCGASHTPISYVDRCTTDFAWSTSSSLCVKGRIAALPPSPTISMDNWGLTIGVNATEPNTSVGSAFAPFTSIAFTFSGEPKTGLRPFIHRKGDPAATSYCYEGRLDSTLDLKKFNTKCWGDTTSVNLTLADLPNIDQIGILIPSQTTAVTVNDFCLTRISFE